MKLSKIVRNGAKGLSFLPPFFGEIDYFTVASLYDELVGSDRFIRYKKSSKLEEKSF
jgi:hypothetical protein